MLAKRYNVVQMRQFFSSKSCVRLLSLPMRGEWIEIEDSCAECWRAYRLSPCGESGLKFVLSMGRLGNGSLSPLGESGLKSCYGCDRCPRSGVWESRLKYQQVFFLQ